MGVSTSTSGPAPAIRSKSLGEEIAEVLQAEIIGGQFQPGQRLVERELTMRFQVSSIPIREALRELETRGLIARRHNRGCTVVQLSHEEAIRICELRRVLEPTVMAWAAERITAAGAERLRAQFERLVRTTEDQDLPGYYREDMSFHRMIWEESANPYAAGALDRMLGSLFASGLIGSQEAKAIDLAEEARKHRRLLDAICEGDSQRAAMALLEIAAGFEKHLRQGGPGTAVGARWGARVAE